MQLGGGPEPVAVQAAGHQPAPVDPEPDLAPVAEQHDALAEIVHVGVHLEVPVARGRSRSVVPTKAVHEAGEVDRGTEGEYRVGEGLTGDEVKPELQPVQPPVDLSPDGEREHVRVVEAGVVLGTDVPAQVLERERPPIDEQAGDPCGGAVQQVEAHQVHRMCLACQVSEEPIGKTVPQSVSSPPAPAAPWAPANLRQT
ncbi:hypothetical protein [Kitasatospora sp. NPDC057541]|uniref:hypothetical protein n=1 Tax=unclassified Kitasatospora TaxID=2633591 RepID=UPI0036ADB51F